MRRHSARPAIKSNSVAWSYSELDVVSSACATAFLRACGEEPAPIALLMNHDAALVAAIAGVLRSGCFYLALNAAHPRARLSQILEETKPKATVADLSHLALARDLSRHTGKVFSFDEINRSTKGAMGRLAPGLDSPCAIFYTSGSTNRPRPLFTRTAAH